MDIMNLNNLFLTIEWGDPWKRQDQTTLRNMVHLGLLKCGKVEMESTIDQGNLSKILGIHWKELILIVKNIFTAGPAHSARNEETIHERTGRPDSEDAQGKANFEKFIVGSDTTEFVNKVKNQVRIRQKRMSDDAEDCTEHSIVWVMFMATTLNAATFMGKNYSTMQNVVQNEEKITLKQMFDITAQTIHNDEEIYCLDKIVYQRNTWTQLSLINDPLVISLQSTKVYVFSDSVLCLGKVLQHPECNEAWKDRVAGVRAEKNNYSDFDDVKGESAEFEWNIFPGITSLQLCDKIINLLSSLGQSPETFTKRILFMSMFNDISCDRYDNKVECLKNADFVKRLQKDLELVNGLPLDQVLRKSGILPKTARKENGTMLLKICYLDLQKVDIPSSVQRHHCPEDNCKVKEKGKCPYTSVLNQIQLIQFIALFSLSMSSVSMGQWQLYAMNMKASQTARGNPLYWRVSQLFLEKSKPKYLLMMKPRDAQIILQQNFQEVKSLSPENRLSKFCKEAGFMSVVEVGQYFVTRNASNFSIR